MYIPSTTIGGRLSTSAPFCFILHSSQSSSSQLSSEPSSSSTSSHSSVDTIMRGGELSSTDTIEDLTVKCLEQDISSVKINKILYKNKSKTRMNCFRYLKLMSPLNAAICTTTYLERQKCYGPGKKILFKKQLFDLEVKVP